MQTLFKCTSFHNFLSRHYFWDICMAIFLQDLSGVDIVPWSLWYNTSWRFAVSRNYMTFYRLGLIRFLLCSCCFCCCCCLKQGPVGNSVLSGLVLEWFGPLYLRQSSTLVTATREHTFSPLSSSTFSHYIPAQCSQPIPSQKSIFTQSKAISED